MRSYLNLGSSWVSSNAMSPFHYPILPSSNSNLSAHLPITVVPPPRSPPHTSTHPPPAAQPSLSTPPSQPPATPPARSAPDSDLVNDASPHPQPSVSLLPTISTTPSSHEITKNKGENSLSPAPTPSSSSSSSSPPPSPLPSSNIPTGSPTSNSPSASLTTIPPPPPPPDKSNPPPLPNTNVDAPLVTDALADVDRDNVGAVRTGSPLREIGGRRESCAWKRLRRTGRGGSAAAAVVGGLECEGCEGCECRPRGRWEAMCAVMVCVGGGFVTRVRLCEGSLVAWVE